MDSQFVDLTCEVELQLGERITIPEALVEQIGAGRSRLKIEAILVRRGNEIRCHDAFLNGYAPDDEGLYDADAD